MIFIINNVINNDYKISLLVMLLIEIFIIFILIKNK